jgi:hypothetical protein
MIGALLHEFHSAALASAGTVLFFDPPLLYYILNVEDEQQGFSAVQWR